MAKLARTTAIARPTAKQPKRKRGNGKELEVKRKETREVNRTHTEIPVKPNPHPTTPHCVIPAKAGIQEQKSMQLVAETLILSKDTKLKLIVGSKPTDGFQPPPPIPAFAGMKGYAGMTEKEQKGAR